MFPLQLDLISLKMYPEKFTDVGISEQNLIGVATGLSEVGFDVITTTFSRNYEAVTNKK